MRLGETFKETAHQVTLQSLVWFPLCVVNFSGARILLPRGFKEVGV